MRNHSRRLLSEYLTGGSREPSISLETYDVRAAIRDRERWHRMSRLVIIAGLATILISLVALVTLAGNSNPSVTEEAAQEPETLETPEPDTEPSTEPEPEPETEPSPTTPEASPEQDEAREDQPLQEEPPVQGIQPGGQAGDRAGDRLTPGAGPRVATVEVTGDAGYSCSMGRIDSPRTVRGTNPASYQVRVAPGGTSLDTVMAVCQKISGEELGVGIIYDGEVKERDETSGRFGTVSVSWSPVQE